MAVSQEFKNNWLACQEEYGKNIEGGDIPVLPLSDFNKAVSLPAVKMAGNYGTAGFDQFENYVHVPLATIEKVLTDKTDEVEGRVQQLEDDAESATNAANAAATAANQAAGSVQTAINQATTAAQNADASRVRIEANESIRQSNESTRQTQETARERQAATDHTTAGNDHTQAGTDHSRAESDHTTAGTDHSRAETDHSRAETDHSRAETDHSRAETDHTNVAGAENIDAQLEGMTVTITNRQGTARSVNIGFEITEDHVYASKAAMRADAANVRAGEFCMIANNDPDDEDNATLWSRNSLPANVQDPQFPFTFLSDLDQASAAAWADWLENKKPEIEAAVETAASDHTRAEGDHTTAGTDHSRAESDHTQAATDSAYARAQGDRAKAFNDHPWEIGGDGYIYVWDETHENPDGTTGAMVKTNKMIINFDDLTEEQRQQMAQDFYDTLVFASDETCESIVDELV